MTETLRKVAATECCVSFCRWLAIVRFTTKLYNEFFALGLYSNVRRWPILCGTVDGLSCLCAFCEIQKIRAAEPSRLSDVRTRDRTGNPGMPNLRPRTKNEKR